MWKIIVHKQLQGQQELKVIALLKEMAQDSYATYADAFISHFQQLVKEIKATNKFTAEHAYKITPRNPESVECWKMTVSGEFKYKIATLNFIK